MNGLGLASTAMALSLALGAAFAPQVSAQPVVSAGVDERAIPQHAPVNLAPNSQWEIWSALGYGTQYNPQGTGTEAPIAAASNTTGALGETTFKVGSTGDLNVGDLVTANGPGVDGALTISPMRVIGLVANTSITVRVPFGKTPVTSSPSTIMPIGVGASWSLSKGGGAGPDGWQRYPVGPGEAPALWRDMLRGNYAVNAPRGVSAYAALGVKLQKPGPAYLYIDYPAGDPRVKTFAGKTVVFGIYGMQKIRGGAGSWRIRFQTDAAGAQTPCTAAAAPAGAYAWLECAYKVPSDASRLSVGVLLDGAKGDTYYFVDPVFTIGSRIGGVENYVKPQGEILTPTVHISPVGWINARIVSPSSGAMCRGMGGYCFLVDPYAETGGQIAPTVLRARGQLEGIDDGEVVLGSGKIRDLAWYDRGAAPEHSGSIMPQYARNVKSFMYMDFPFNQTDRSPDLIGTGIFQDNVPGDAWSNVSLEFDEFTLQ